MSYREKPREKPLIWTLSQRVIALDPENGAKLWDLQMESNPERTFVFGRSAAGEQIFPAAVW